MKRTLLLAFAFLAAAAPQQGYAQVIVPNEQLAPPLLEPSDSAERWYGTQPGDRRIRVEVRMNSGDNALTGRTYQGQNFGSRTMQVLPILIIVDVVQPKPGEIEPEMDFSVLASGNLSAAKQEGAIFKVAHQEAMRPGEQPVTISGAPETVTVDWGELRYTAKRWRILVNVQCQVRPRDGKPLPKPQAFACQFAYSTSARSADGPREWRTAWTPPFGVTTNWTADSGSMVSLPTWGEVESPRSLPMIGFLLFVALVLLYASVGEPLLRRLRRGNVLHAMDPEEEFWQVVLPLFESNKVAGGYALDRNTIIDIIASLKHFADSKGAGASVCIRLSTSTADVLMAQKHNIICGEDLARIIYPLEVDVVRNGGEFKPGAASDLLNGLRRVVAGFPD